MSTERKKTILRTVRLTRDLDNLLQKDAKDRRLSTNALISSIITKYAEWDRYAEKFGFISLTKDGFRAIIEVAEKDKIIKIAEELGDRIVKEIMLFWFKKMNVETFLASLSLFCRYAGISEYELETEGRDYTLTFHHDLGEKWSNFLAHLLVQGIKSTLGIIPKFDLSKSSVIIRFFVP